MRFVVLAILLAFPAADLYVTSRIARWTGVPLWIWLAGSFLAGLLLLRNERLEFRTRTVAALHGEQSLLRGVLDSGRKVLAAFLLILPGHRVRPHGAAAARAAAERRPRLRAAAAARRAALDHRRRYAHRRRRIRRVDVGRSSRYFIRSITVGSAFAGAPVRPHHHPDAEHDHRQRQQLPHREARPRGSPGSCRARARTRRRSGTCRSRRGTVPTPRPSAAAGSRTSTGSANSTTPSSANW